MNSEECELRWQKQFGILYEDNAFIIFQAQVIHVSTVVSMYPSYQVLTHKNNYPNEPLAYCLTLKDRRLYNDYFLQAFLIDVFARPKIGAFQRNYVNGGPSCDEADEDGESTAQ